MRNNEFLSNERLSGAISDIHKILSRNIIKFIDSKPTPFTDANGIYNYSDEENVFESWYYGFWVGLFWLAYEVTGAENFRCYAQAGTKKILESVEKRAISHSDVGLMCFPSCVASYKLTGNEAARKGIIFASNSLMFKYKKGANMIFESENETVNHRESIKISDLINLSLLYTSYEFTNNLEYFETAMKNIELITKYCVSSDTIFFRYYFNTETGMPLFGAMNPIDNKYLVDSAMRANAWAIFGLAVNYAKTKNSVLLEKYMQVVNDFITKLPSDYICRYGMGENTVFDTLSSLIAVCGIMEMANNSTLDVMKEHYDCACKILNSLIINCAAAPEDEGESFLKYGIASFVMNRNVRDSGNNCGESSIQADYFYFEACMRALGNWKSYWTY